MQPKTSVGREFQDNLLARLMERGQPTTIYLQNRMSLRGRVLRYDAYVILLEPADGGPAQMVYKSAVVSVSGTWPGPRGPRGPRPGSRREGDRPERPGFEGYRPPRDGFRRGPGGPPYGGGPGGERDAPAGRPPYREPGSMGAAPPASEGHGTPPPPARPEGDGNGGGE